MLKEIGAIIIRYSGLPQIIRNMYARNKVAIVTYHDPRPELLDKHLSYLSRRYNIIPLSLVAAALHNKDWSKIPPKSLVVTLDDGHSGNYRLLETFKKHGIVPTIYLCTRIVCTNRHYWWTTLDAGRRSALKIVPNAERLKILEEEYCYTNTREYPEEPRQTLTELELKRMLPFVDFGSHTQTHPILTACTDDECEAEIFASKKDVEDILSVDCLHFSYPNGDYNEREKELVRKAGYRTSRTIDVGWNDINSDPYRLKITGIPDDASQNVLIAHLTGIPLYLKYLAKGSFTGKFSSSV